MNKVLHKLSFAVHITAGLPSLLRLLWHSKKLRWSKSGFVKARSREAMAAIDIQHSLGKRTIYLRTFEGDIDIFYEIFFKEIYALPGRQTGPIKTVVDLGANVGLSALYFLHQYPKAQVICVEPEASNFKMLTKNLRPEIARGTVKALQVAAMAQDGFVSFAPAEAKYNSRVMQDGDEKNIPAVSMPSLMERNGINHIDILKVDVEGAEKYIFSGNIDWLQKVDNVLIELHSDKDRVVCMRAFEQYNFVVKGVQADESNDYLLWASRKR